MIIKDYTQGSLEWLEMRKTHIMASDAPVIMGMSPWSTPLQLWEEKLGLKEPFSGNFATQRGTELEPLALEAYNNHTGNGASPCVVFSEETPWMGASLDGLSKCGKIVVEIKCPGKKNHNLAAFGKIPPEYFAQLQHQLYTSGNNMLHYFSYSEESCYLIEVLRDEVFIKKMLEAEKKFWDMLNNFESPEMMKDDIKKKFVQVSCAEWSEISEEVKVILVEKKALKEQESSLKSQLKHLEAREAKLKAILVAISKGENAEGNGIKLELTSRKGLVDYSIIPELEGVDLEKYRKPSSESWKVS
jgi:putative phage-type endonuclease